MISTSSCGSETVGQWNSGTVVQWDSRLMISTSSCTNRSTFCHLLSLPSIPPYNTLPIYYDTFPPLYDALNTPDNTLVLS